jgi:predicted RNA-binding protein with RPS1 domain
MEEIRIKKIKPMYTKVLLTKDMYTDESFIAGTGIIDASKIKQGVKEIQKVLAVGTSVREVQVGDIVSINPDRYAVRSYTKDTTKEMLKDEFYNTATKYAFPVIEVDGKECLYLDERDIDFVVTDYVELKN